VLGLHKNFTDGACLQQSASYVQDSDTFAARAQAVLDRVKNAERQPGVQEILLPGERSAAAAAASLAKGTIAVEANLLENLRKIAARTSAPPAAADSSNWALATRLVHPLLVDDGCEDPATSMAAPIYQTATFKQPGATENGPYDYTRSGNPTRSLLEKNMADLEGGTAALAFVTGMAAIAAACRVCKSGLYTLYLFCHSFQLLDKYHDQRQRACSHIHAHSLCRVLLSDAWKLLYVVELHHYSGMAV
jgi:hypothetical protein